MKQQNKGVVGWQTEESTRKFFLKK
jgi:hypothetical protein